MKMVIFKMFAEYLHSLNLLTFGYSFVCAGVNGVTSTIILCYLVVHLLPLKFLC